MIRAERIEVGTDPVDLAENSGISGVSVQWLRNAGKTDLFLGAVRGGIPLAPGESVSNLALNSTDHLPVVRERGKGPVDIVLGWA